MVAEPLAPGRAAQVEVKPTKDEEPAPVTPPPRRRRTRHRWRPAASAIEDLRNRQLTLPVQGIKRDDLRDTFNEMRGSSRRHEALDVLAPRNTPVLAVEDGTIARLFLSDAGGITIYQFDPTTTYVYYYAHLERYAEGLKEGAPIKRGQVHRLCRHHRQRAAQHAAPALRDLQAHRRKEVVAGDRRSILIRS